MDAPKQEHSTYLNMYRYLANMIVATRREGLMARLAALAAEECDPAKAEILREALALR